MTFVKRIMKIINRMILTIKLTLETHEQNLIMRNDAKNGYSQHNIGEGLRQPYNYQLSEQRRYQTPTTT